MNNRETEDLFWAMLNEARFEVRRWRNLAAIGWGVAFIVLGANVAAWLGWLP